MTSSSSIIRFEIKINKLNSEIFPVLQAVKFFPVKSRLVYNLSFQRSANAYCKKTMMQDPAAIKNLDIIQLTETS